MDNTETTPEPAAPPKPIRHVAYFEYNDDRTALRVEYNPEYNEVVITGGRHGYARLAEMCACFAEFTGGEEHEHWNPRRDSRYDLTLVVWNKPPKPPKEG